MKSILIIAVILLSGCSSMDEFVCRGAGTCYTNAQGQLTMANGMYAGQSANFVPTGAQSIITSNGTYLVGRSQSTGAINSVIRTSKGK